MPRATYHAAVLAEPNTPLAVQELPVLAPGPGSVTVEVDLAGVCGTDIHISTGHLPVPLPLVLGHEAVGRVDQLGEGVSADVLGNPLRPGDLVTWASNIPCGNCYYCVEEQELSLCANRKVYGINLGVQDWPGGSGGYGQRMLLQPGSTIIRLPESVSAEQSIALGCAGPTVVHGLLGKLPPRLGETVIVQGSGPVGLAAAMYAKLGGARSVIMVGAPASRLELAASLGACDEVIGIDEVTDVEERLARLLALTPGGRGADLVVEATGHPTAVQEGFRLCRRNGRYLVLGQYTDHGPAPLNPHLITKGQLTVVGSWAFTGGDYVRYVKSLPLLAQRFDLARLVTPYPLGQANQALADMREGRVLKAVIDPTK